jgi:hypothetical protein
VGNERFNVIFCRYDFNCLRNYCLFKFFLRLLDLRDDLQNMILLKEKKDIFFVKQTETEGDEILDE